jgi:hypothetical protein
MLDDTIMQWEKGKLFVAHYEDGHWERAMAKLWLQWVVQEAMSIHLTVCSRTGSPRNLNSITEQAST